MRRRHRVDGQEIERRRTVHQDVGEICLIRRRRLEWRKRVAQPESAVARLADFKFKPREIEGRRRKVKPRHGGCDDRVAQRRLASQHIIGRVQAASPIDAEAGRGIALRIEIDDQHVLADRRERGAKIDRGRGLADAALLVGDRQHARRFGAPAAGSRRRRKGDDAADWSEDDGSLIAADSPFLCGTLRADADELRFEAAHDHDPAPSDRSDSRQVRLECSNI